MKLLHVIASVDQGGGGPIAGIVALAPALKRLGCETEVASLDHPERVDGGMLGVPVYALGTGAHGYRYSSRFKTWLCENIGRFDATIVHGIWTYHSLAAWDASRLAGRPYFVYPHGMLDPWFKRTYPWKHLKKLAYWTLFEGRVIRDASGVLFTCEQERLLAKQSFPGYRCKEIVVGVGTPASGGNLSEQTEAFFAICPHLCARPFLLFLGRLHPKKGLNLLLHAYAERLAQSEHEGIACPDLVIAGPPVTEGYFRELRSVCQNLRISTTDLPISQGRNGRESPSVTFCPMLMGPAKWGALEACEAFILPSHQENFGIAVTEALSCSRPVLISHQVNIWREIEGEGAGIVEADSIEGTTRLLASWQGLSEGERAAMGRRAAACFQQHFETNRVAQSLIEAVSAHSLVSRLK